MKNGHLRYQILMKEIDQIHDSIKNLDDIMFKTRNFAILFWGGSIFLIADHLAGADSQIIESNIKLLFALTAIIPLIFWVMHFRWQIHLTKTGQREEMISLFLNSPNFDEWLKEGATPHFPLYDVPGWLYTTTPSDRLTEKFNLTGVKVDPRYLLNPKEIRLWKLFFYKDAKWYYSMMIIGSLLVAGFYA